MKFPEQSRTAYAVLPGMVRQGLTAACRGQIFLLPANHAGFPLPAKCGHGSAFRKVWSIADGWRLLSNRKIVNRQTEALRESCPSVADSVIGRSQGAPSLRSLQGWARCCQYYVLVSSNPLRMRSWFPPFAKCAKDGAPAAIKTHLYFYSRLASS